jgi:hypothetical protein
LQGSYWRTVGQKKIDLLLFVQYCVGVHLSRAARLVEERMGHGGQLRAF